MSSEPLPKVKRQQSWDMLSAAAHRELVPLQATSQLHNLTYHDKYVICYEFNDVDYDEAINGFVTLLGDLEAIGLHVEVRAGYDQSLLIFVKAPEEILGNAVYKSRVQDWLYGIIAEHPGDAQKTITSTRYEAEDLLSVYQLVSSPKEMGGAGVTPEFGRFKNVKSIFPLHNPGKNQSLLRHLSQRIFLRDEDFDRIRDLFGPKTAFYFAFTQTYLIFLFFPAITGLVARFFLSIYSRPYSILIGLWCIVFVEYWKLKQTDLSIRWNVKGVRSLRADRPQFIYDKVIVDSAGRTKHYYPRWKQFPRRLLQIPFVLVAALCLGVLIAIVFAIEVLITEAYDGPHKTYLEYLPTAVLAIGLPYINQFLEGTAASLTEFENHRTADSHERSLAQKVFVLHFTTQYLPVLLTAFVYVPFGDLFIPHLEQLFHYILGDAARFTDMPFQANPERLQREVIALTVTGQISHFGEEFVIPFVKQRLSSVYRNYRTSQAEGITPERAIQDDPEEQAFLFAARNQATLPPYDVQSDISQMVLQYGYLALFSPVWPLVPIGFLINNWIELRSDFLKICIEHQRPASLRTDGIGLWVQNMEFLTWLGSISTAAIVHLFGVDVLSLVSPKSIGWWTLPVTIVVSEHLSLAVRYVVQSVLRNIGSEQIRKETDANYVRRKQYLDKLESNKCEMLGLGIEQRERRKSVLMTDGNKFWTKQVEDGKSKAVGVQLIEMFKKADDRLDKGSGKDKTE